jgi:hypothetical protein
MIRLLTVLGFLTTWNALAADELFAPGDDNPAPTLGAPAAPTTPPAYTANTTTPTPTKTDSNVGTPSSPEEQPAVPLSAIPGKTEALPNAKAVDTAGEKRDIYDQYDDYLKQEKDRQESESTIGQRAMFPHENGFWQLGFAYNYHAFSNYDFSRGDPRFSRTYADTSGPGLELMIYPIKSLTFGRLGFGIDGAYYWSSFALDNGSGGKLQDKPSNGSMYTYGVRAEYEFDYWLGQILVPFGFVGYDQVFVKGYKGQVNGIPQTDFSSYRKAVQTYGGGAHFNLNRVEPVTASRALVNTGIRKFYLTYAATQRTGGFSGLTHSLGLTFEF